MDEIQELEKIIPQLISIQKQLDFIDDNRTFNFNNLKKLAEVAEIFINKTPALSVNAYNDEVIVSGLIPNVHSPQDISVTLDSGKILRISCTWHKADDTGNIISKPLDFKKKIELPFPVNPGTLSATYKKGMLQISARKAADRNLWSARVQFLD